MTGALRIERGHGPWVIERAGEKLTARARLPGAFGYDQAAHTFRRARAAGLTVADLLPAALPCSWMVNAKTTSPIFRRWLQPPLVGAWEALLALCSDGPDAWLARSSADRDAVAELVRTLSVDAPRLAGVSKVLALLCPETVPLMDDAAIWFALDGVPQPATPDAPTAAESWCVPMLDWFSRAVLAAERELIALAREHRSAVLDSAQVLDRLLWFDSYGHRVVPIP